MCPGQQRLEPAHALDAADTGQVDVHEHHVGVDGRELREGIFGAEMLADAGKPVRLIDQPGKAPPDARVILDDRHPNRLGAAAGWMFRTHDAVSIVILPGMRESPVLATGSWPLAARCRKSRPRAANGRRPRNTRFYLATEHTEYTELQERPSNRATEQPN